MNGSEEDFSRDIDIFSERLKKEATASGYHLNPDVTFVRGLAAGLLLNEERYGYASCPCRLATADRREDLDIICPCDYRDADLAEYGTCYCALYVSQVIAEGAGQTSSIPERRLPPAEQGQPEAQGSVAARSSLSHPVWRCRVCGYLCAREDPPELCPICKAQKERFERFM